MTKAEAIKTLRELWRETNDSWYEEAYNMAIEALKERPTGKWVGGQEYCKHLEEKTGERYAPTGLGKLVYCNQCWQANDRHSAYCPNCGSRMGGEL